MSFPTRTVLCNDPEMTLPPVNIPVDTTKLRIEKTAIRRVPGEAFHLLHNLEYLWMPYNSLASLSGITFKGLRHLQELRLDGNNLISFPWESLAGMPQLRLLDLHNNELTSIPSEAARYVKNITYLDLSSNKLMTLPQALIATWANLQAVPYFPNDNSKIILGKRSAGHFAGGTNVKSSSSSCSIFTHCDYHRKYTAIISIQFNTPNNVCKFICILTSLPQAHHTLLIMP